MERKSVTGRDAYIIAKALAYAILAIDSLPEERREEGDKEDMKLLLDDMIESDVQLARVIDGARSHFTGEGLELDE